MKKIIPILLLCLVLICFLPMGALKANAAEYKEGNWTYTVSNGKATVVSYGFNGNSVTIPSELGGYPVTTIGLRASKNKKFLVYLTIPDSVTTIEESAFEGCPDLTTVTMGNGVTTIKRYAFYNCFKLEKVVLGNSLTSIREYAFEGCEKLTAITLPETLIEIRNGAFSGCKALTKVTIPDSVTSFSLSVFSQCTGLTEVTLGSGVKKIWDDCFNGCTSLKTIRVSSNLQEVKANAFKNCTSLKNVYHTGGTGEMQQLKNNIAATGNEYLKNASWQHACKFVEVDGKTPTCTETGKYGYYQCAACGKCSQNPDGSMSISNISKWGIIDAKGHTLGSWQSDGSNHWKVCSTCKKKVDNASHSGGSWQSDGSNHWKICSICQQKAQNAAHSGGTSTCQSKKQCTICNTFYGNLANHVWSKTWDYSTAEGHYHKCQTPGCDQFSPVEAHAPGAAATETREQVCTVCNYIITPKLNHKHTTQKYAAVKATCEKNGNVEYYACTGCAKIFKDADATKEYADLSSVLIVATGHKYTENWNMDSTMHWRACTSCGVKEGIENHIPGAEATETTDQTCTVCSYVITKSVAHIHSFSEYWFNDDSAHWKACVCGEENEKAAYADGDGNFECDNCYLKMENNESVTDDIDEPTDNEKPLNEQTPIPEENDDDEEGVPFMVIVVCILGTVFLAMGAVLVVILVKRKKQ